MFKMFQNLKKTSEEIIEEELSKQDTYPNMETTRQPKLNPNPNDDDWQVPTMVHRVGEDEPLDDQLERKTRAIISMGVQRSKKKYSKEYIPLGALVENMYLMHHEIKNFHFEHIFLNSSNASSLHKVVFKHNEQTKQIRFYIPTFLRFSLVKLHSQDLKNITHIQNKNSMIIYINVLTRGLPKMLIDKLVKRTKGKDGEQEEAKLLFRANRHLFQAKYYTSYNDYLIFMFNPFSENMIEFEIMKNVMFAPFEEAELILHIRINKKVFKMERSKTLKIAKTANNMATKDSQSPSSPSPSPKNTQQYDQKRPQPSQDSTPVRKPVSSQSITDHIEQLSDQSSQQQQFDILHFNKIVMQFKLQKPKNVTDSFRFHKSIEFGNYGIMTNEINIHIGSYESPEKKKELEEERAQLIKNGLDEEDDQEEIHEYQLDDISSMRLSIGLYKHPVTDLCTFFIPLMLSGGLTLLLFHMCDHSLSNELQILAIILVAYGAFIPQFRQRISMSRTALLIDFYILFNMIPAILCAVQSIAQSNHKKSYNVYQVVSVILYEASLLFLGEVYLLYLYVDRECFQKHVKEMVHNFDTDIFQTNQFQDDPQKCLSWFVLKNQKERAFFCERQEPKQKERIKKPRFTRKQTHPDARSNDPVEPGSKASQIQELGQSVALQIQMSAMTSKNFNEAKQAEEDENERQHEQHEQMYKTKEIQNEKHVHSFEKVLTFKHIVLGVFIILFILSATVLVSWTKIYQILNFEDLNRDCIHDEEESKRLARVQNIISKEEKLSQLISQNWNDASIPVPDDVQEPEADTHQQKPATQKPSKIQKGKKHQNTETSSLHDFHLRHHQNSR